MAVPSLRRSKVDLSGAPSGWTSSGSLQRRQRLSPALSQMVQRGLRARAQPSQKLPVGKPHRLHGGSCGSPASIWSCHMATVKELCKKMLLTRASRSDSRMRAGTALRAILSTNQRTTSGTRSIGRQWFAQWQLRNSGQKSCECAEDIRSYTFYTLQYPLLCKH